MNFYEACFHMLFRKNTQMFVHYLQEKEEGGCRTQILIKEATQYPYKIKIILEARLFMHLKVYM